MLSLLSSFSVLNRAPLGVGVSDLDAGLLSDDACDEEDERNCESQ